MKSKVIYIISICCIVFLMWFGNEGDNTLEYLGTELQYSAGVPDSEYALVVRDSVAKSGIIAKTPEFVMNKGTYKVDLKYEADNEGSVLELWEAGNKIAGWELNPDEAEFSTEFTLAKDSKQLTVKVNFSGKGLFRLKKLSLTPGTLFYTDTYFMIAVFLLLNLLGYLLYKRQAVKPISRDKLVDACIIVGVALLATSPMFSTYLYDGDDLCYHLTRIEGIKDGILDGQIPVIIMPDGLRGNGYLNAMYPYLFLYIAAFLRILRVSIALSYKVVIFLTNLGSAVCAYYAFRSMTESRRSVILAVVLYTLMPYRFTNIFSRGDLGETLALTFWPLVIAGVYHILLGERKKWYYLVIGFSGIIQSHVLSAVFVVAFCVIAGLVFSVNVWKEKRYIETGKAAGLTILLNMWFIVPFLYYYFCEDLGTGILRWSGYFEQSINPSNLAQSISLYNKQYFSLGLPLLGCLGIGVLYIIFEKTKKRTKMNAYLTLLLAMSIMLTFMTTGYFPSLELCKYKFFNSFMTMLQFPWRFLGPACACVLFAGGIWLSESELLMPYRNLIFTLLVGLNLLTLQTVPTDNIHMPYDDVMATASKGHDSKLAANIGVFYPHEWRLGGIEDEQLVTSVIVSDLNHVNVSAYGKKGTKVQTVYTSDAGGTYIELPVLNYFGYRAYDENGKRLEITEGENHRIRIDLNGDGMEHMIRLRFGPVAGFVAADVISALTILVIACAIYNKKYKNRRLPNDTEYNSSGL